MVFTLCFILLLLGSLFVLWFGFFLCVCWYLFVLKLGSLGFSSSPSLVSGFSGFLGSPGGPSLNLFIFLCSSVCVLMLCLLCLAFLVLGCVFSFVGLSWARSIGQALFALFSGSLLCGSMNMLFVSVF